MCSAPAAFRNCARRICPPVVWPARAGRKTRLKQTMDPPLPPESALPATKSRGACSRLFRPGAGERQPRAAAPRTRPWAGRSGPLTARAGGRGAVPGKRPAINCQKFTALCLFKPSSESEPYPPGQKTRQSPRGKQRGILRRLSAAVADRPDGWRGRAVSPPGRNRTRLSCAAGPRSSAGRLGAGTGPQPGLTVVQAG